LIYVIILDQRWTTASTKRTCSFTKIT